MNSVEFVDEAARRAEANVMSQFEAHGIKPDKYEMQAITTGIFAGISETIGLMRDLKEIP